jgi:hypothetical protein
MAAKKSFADKWFESLTDKQTSIYLPGGKLVVPGHAKTDRGIVGLVQRAIQKGKARVVPKSR